MRLKVLEVLNHDEITLQDANNFLARND